MRAPRGIETGVLCGKFAEHLAGEWQLREIVEREQVGAESIVDVVRVVGNIIGNRAGLRLGAVQARKLEILPYLARLRDEGHVPMVYVSHQAGEIQKLATQVVRIEDGRVEAAGGLELLDAETAHA